MLTRLPELTIDDLRPGDALLFEVNMPKWINWLAKMLIKYGHVAMDYDKTKRGLPLITESTGRGAAIHSLYVHTGRRVLVRRPQVNLQDACKIAEESEHIADNPSSWYGYYDIPRFALPKLVLMKIGSLLPQKWTIVLKAMAYSYKANSVVICSELYADSCEKGGFPICDDGTIPLPDDIAASECLDDVGYLNIEPPASVKMRH
jgi:hypothetical protein